MADLNDLATGPSGVDPPSLGRGLASLAGEPALSNAAKNLTQAALNTQGLGTFIEWVVPKANDRIQMDSSLIFAEAFLQIFLPLLIMGLLARQKGTLLIRRALTPILTISALRGTCAYRWRPTWDVRLNYQLTLLGYGLALKVVEWGLAPKGRRLLSEIAPNVPKDEKERAELGKLSGMDLAIYRFKDWWYMMSNMRGINWDFGTGTGLKLPVITKNVNEKQIWILQTIRDIVRRYIILDVLGTLLFVQPWAPDIPTHHGAPMWNPALPLFKRFVVGTIIHMSIMESIKEFGHLVYDFNSLICVSFLGHTPTQWPPLFGNSWRSTSFAHYWGTQWHQVLRQTFLILLGYPMGAVFGVIGMVIGTFLASGLLHTWSFYGMDGIQDHSLTWAFTSQGLGLLGERAYYKLTGKKVEGRVGSILVSLGVIFAGQHCTDAWTRQGIVGNLIIPPEASICQSYVYPWFKTTFPSLVAAGWK